MWSAGVNKEFFAVYCTLGIKSSRSCPVLWFIFWIYTFDGWTLQIQTRLYRLLPFHRLQRRLRSTELPEPTLLTFPSFPEGRAPSQATVRCLSVFPHSWHATALLSQFFLMHTPFPPGFCQLFPASCTPLPSVTVSFSSFGLKNKNIATITLKSMKTLVRPALLKWGNYVC